MEKDIKKNNCCEKGGHTPRSISFIVIRYDAYTPEI